MRLSGLFTGLVYTPSVFAGTHELVEIAKVAHEYGGVYTTISAGEGKPAEGIHRGGPGHRPGKRDPREYFPYQGHRPSDEGNSRDIIRYIEENQKAGMTITADQYPFTGGSAPLILPDPAQISDRRKGRGTALSGRERRAVKAGRVVIFHEAHEFEEQHLLCGL